MSTIPVLSEDDIRARVGDQSFQRGWQYFHDGAIFGARRQEMTLKAECAGSQAPSYRVEATFDEHGITTADCSCPVGDGGYCKHIAALLLTWRDRPAEFIELEDLERALARKSKDELITLIKLMLRRSPDLELLVATPIPTEGSRWGQGVDPDVYRRQVSAAFRRGGYEWGSESDIAADLDAIMMIGEEFVGHGDIANAVTVFQAVAMETLEHCEQFSDESGDLGQVIHDCSSALGRCLAAVQDEGMIRKKALEALFMIYRTDVNLGGIGLSDDVPDSVLENATTEERRMVAGWVRDALPTGTDWNATFRRQVFGGFLLALEEDLLDDETYLRICRETGRVFDLVERLLTLGRIDDALAAAELAGEEEIGRLADLFVTHEHAAEAERLMQERAAASADIRVLTWLLAHHKAHGSWAAALAIAEQIFRKQQTFEGYIEMRDAGRKLGRWEAARPRVLAYLARHEQIHLLIRIYLDEGEIDQALSALKTAKLGWSHGYGGGNIALDVAQAAEATRPRAALDIYRREAERLIALQGRPNYQAACRLLARVRDVYTRLGEEWAWTGYLNGLRESNRRLRAFQEELATARL